MNGSAGSGEWKKRDRLSKRAFLLGFAARVGCADCGETDPVVLQFDHTDRGSKERQVSHLVSFNYGFDAIIREIEKCEVRCANCHTRRTAKQMNWYAGHKSWMN